MQYIWEAKTRTVLEHLHKGTTPEDLLELMLKCGVFEASEKEKEIILSCVYSSTNHVYFGGTWDPMGMMNKKTADSLKEIKDTLDKLVEAGTISKEHRDRRWKEIQNDCSRPNPFADFHKKEYERIESLLKTAVK